MLIAYITGKPMSRRSMRIARAGSIRAAKTMYYRKRYAHAHSCDYGHCAWCTSNAMHSRLYMQAAMYAPTLDEAWVDINSMVYEQTRTMRQAMPAYTADRWEYEQDRYFEELSN